MHAAFCSVAEGCDCDVQVAGLFGNLMANTVDAAAASSDDAHANGICCHCWFLREMQIKVIVKNIPIISKNKSHLETLGMIPRRFTRGSEYGAFANSIVRTSPQACR